MFFLFPIALVLVGIAAQIAVRLAYGVRGPEYGDSFYLLVKIASWALIGCGCVVWLLLSLGALPICAMLGVLIGFAVVDATSSAREMHRRNNSKLIAIAIREGQLSHTVDLLSQGQQGWFVGEAATHLAGDLKLGTPLYESVVASPAALPRAATAYAAIGTMTEAPAEALEALAAPDHPQLDSSWRVWSSQLAYALAILLTMGVMMGFFCAFIVPQFESIFWDFGVELPEMTQVIINASGYSLGWALLAFIAIVSLIVAFIVGVFYLLDTPVLRFVTDRVSRNAHVADALRLLALAIEHKAELPRAIYALSVTHPVQAIRCRFSDSYQDIAAGQHWADVLVHNRLLANREKALVETAGIVGNLPWALRQIASRREAALMGRLTAIGQLVFPLMVLAIGMFVGFIVVALFLPITGLISGLS